MEEIRVSDNLGNNSENIHNEHHWNRLRLAFTGRSKKMAHRFDYQVKVGFSAVLLGCFIISLTCSANIHTMREIRAEATHDIFTPASVLKMPLNELKEVNI
jgi:hypothetical protein